MDDSDSCFFDNLDYYSVQKILDYLLVDDRFRISRVCKKWEQSAKDSCMKIKTINCLHGYGLRFRLDNEGHWISNLNSSILKQIISRCPILENLDLIYCACTGIDILVDLARYCPMIKKIATHTVSDKGIALLGKNCFHLEDILFDGRKYCNKFKTLQFKDSCQGILFYPKLLNSLLKNCSQLKILSFKNLVFVSRIETKSSIIVPSGLILETLVLENIRILSIDDNHVSDIKHSHIFLELIKSLQKLKKFIFKKNNFNLVKIIETLNSTCKNITNLVLECPEDLEISDAYFITLFITNKGIINLELRKFSLTGSCLKFLNVNLQNLVLYKMYNLKFSFLELYIPLFINLRTIDVMKISNTCSKNILSLPHTNLQNVSISGCFEFEQIIFRNLIKLELFDNLSTSLNNFLKNIEVMTTLREVSLFKCSSITDVDLQLIIKLPKLEKLDISFLQNMNGSGLLSNNNVIKQVRIYGCKNVESDYINMFIEKSPNLECLKMFRIRIFGLTETAKFINAAIKATKMRANNCILTLKCMLDDYEDCIKKKVIEEIRGNLEIINFDECDTSSECSNASDGEYDSEFDEW